MDLVSIVVPVYNAEKYIVDCLESIKNQSYKNCEVILIDDGSTDNSGKICDRYAESDKRFKVFHYKNRGVSSARNEGIKKSNGKYLVFVDVDDWIEDNYVEKFLNVIDKTNYAQCNFNICLDDKKYSENIIDKSYFLDDVNKIKKSIFSINYGKKNKISNSRCVCGKMYNLNILKRNNIYFNKDIYLLEDGIFNLEYIKHCNGCYLISESLYNYRQVPSSSSHRYNEDQLKQYNMVEEILYGYISNDYEKELYYVLSFQHLITYIVRNIRFKNNFKKNTILIKNVCSNKYKKIIKNVKYRHLNIMEKGFLFLIRFRLYYFLYLLLSIREKLKRR